MGTMTARYQLGGPLVAESTVVDTYTASPNGMPLKVFVKVIAPSLTAQAGFAARFQENIQIQLKFASQNIVKLLDYGTDQEYFFIVLEHHKSPPLAAQIADSGALGTERAIDYGIIIATVLDYANNLKITHGLLSPLSIHVSKSRGPMITDWGIAGLVTGSRLPRAILDDTTLPGYVAPEILRGQPVTAQADQYSLAALIVTMATGYTIKQGGLDHPPLSPLLPALRRALSPTPEERFPTVAAFSAALSTVKAALAESQRPVAMPSTPAPVIPAPVEPPIAPDYKVPDSEPSNAGLPPPIDRTLAEPIRVASPPPVMPPPPPKPVEPPPAAAYDRTMPEMNVADIRKAAEDAMKAALEPPAPAKPAAPPPPKPVEPPPAAAPAAYDRTMPEMNVADIRKAAEDAMKAALEPPAPAKPAAPPPPKPVEPPPAAAYDRTMPEMNVADIRKAAEDAMKAALEPPAPAKPAAPPPPKPVEPPPAAAPAVYDRTMPEMSVDEIRKAAAAAMAAALKAPNRPPEPEPTPPPSAPEVHEVDDVVPVVEEVVEVVDVEPEPVEPLAVYVEPEAAEEIYVDPNAEPEVEPEASEAERFRRPTGNLPPEIARPAAAASPKSAQVPPAAPAARPYQSPKTPATPAAAPMDVTMPPTPFDPKSGRVAQKPAAAAPPPPQEAPAAPAAYSAPTVPPAAKIPEPPAFKPYQPISKPPQAAPPASAPPRMDATMPEMPAVGYTPPPPPPSSGGMRLDATMPEMPAVSYTPPSSLPPAQGQEYASSQQSVPYNFNTVQGGAKGGRRQIDNRYRTGALSREEIESGRAAGAGGPPRSGLTEMIRTVQPSTPPASAPQAQGRKRSPIVWIVLALVLVLIAAGIGFVVLKALNVL
jgi:serine/threonine protein kinase